MHIHLHLRQGTRLCELGLDMSESTRIQAPSRTMEGQRTQSRMHNARLARTLACLHAIYCPRRGRQELVQWMIVGTRSSFHVGFNHDDFPTAIARLARMGPVTGRPLGEARMDGWDLGDLREEVEQLWTPLAGRPITVIGETSFEQATPRCTGERPERCGRDTTAAGETHEPPRLLARRARR
ncbi:hypothetical protein DAEQUDRAFT_43815 [Daedalea quercina L-15889]|uniref:Uncharacterized protein n=1 Tax=Daedalea quercina L-15889 TaxID=1314783 RepID=A0A165LCP8_9APHY|nr:hypothetical protein DAEQUDRAFT_43815 [Daedalea quercina L-15889]